MKSLYLRIWLTVVAVLLLFALVAGWLFQSNVEHERDRMQSMWAERAAAWAALIENSLPERDAAPAEQRNALFEWSQRLRLPLALDDARGQRIATSESFARRELEAGNAPQRRSVRLPLSDGRTLWIMRPGPGGGRAAAREGGAFGGAGPGGAAFALPRGWVLFPPAWGGGVGLVVALVLLFVAIALGAYPVVRRLTRRLEALQRGVETFGAGRLSQRVDAGGRDEVAALARSFNAAAQRIEALVDSHRSLLANASHELRSPLTRMKMALTMFDDAQPQARARVAQRNRAQHPRTRRARRRSAACESPGRARRSERGAAHRRGVAAAGRRGRLARQRGSHRRRRDAAGRRTPAAPRAAQPARERAALRRRRSA